MNEELTYVLEENNKNDIARILNNETLCELHKEKDWNYISLEWKIVVLLVYF